MFPSCYTAAMHFFSKRAYSYAAKTLMRCSTLPSGRPEHQREEVAYSLAQCFVGTLAHACVCVPCHASHHTIHDANGDTCPKPGFVHRACLAGIMAIFLKDLNNPMFALALLLRLAAYPGAL
jgi:hypothetical protein